MIKIPEETFLIYNFESALRGMRNPLNSHHKSDTIPMPIDMDLYPGIFRYAVGKNDLALARKLTKAGPEHRKFLRQIFVSMDITAPLYWWKEMDTYKVGTAANSESTMHMITKKPFTAEQFSHDKLVKPMWDGAWEQSKEFIYTCFGDEGQLEEWAPYDLLTFTIGSLNFYRDGYLKAIEAKNQDLAKEFWWQIIQLLPSSWNQTRTWTGNFENLLTILHQRSNHKLDEWRIFCEIILERCVFLKQVMSESEDKEESSEKSTDDAVESRAHGIIKRIFDVRNDNLRTITQVAEFIGVGVDLIEAALDSDKLVLDKRGVLKTVFSRDVDVDNSPIWKIKSKDDRLARILWEEGCSVSDICHILDLERKAVERIIYKWIRTKQWNKERDPSIQASAHLIPCNIFDSIIELSRDDEIGVDYIAHRAKVSVDVVKSILENHAGQRFSDRDFKPFNTTVTNRDLEYLSKYPIR